MDSDETVSPEIDEALTLAPHCALAAASVDGPCAGGSPFWWDGAGLWVPGSPAREVVAALGHDPRAAVYVAPRSPGAPGVLVRGRADLYGVGDVVGLAVHGMAVGIAASGLALKYAAELGVLARDLPRAVASDWPAGLTFARVVGDDVRRVDPPLAEGGIGPALPSAVPSAVRRMLTGQRGVVLATVDGDEPVLAPAVWSTDLRIDTGAPLADGTAAAAVVAEGWAGLAIEGTLRDGRLDASRVRWWSGLVGGAADIPAAAPGGIEMPE